MREKVDLRQIRTILACACAGAAMIIAAAPAAAAGSYSPYDETATSALARYVRTLASNPKDFEALIGAGRAALEVGDTQAAAGFFARADEVNPRSPLPQAGMGAVSVANGEPLAALPYFKRAQQLGAKLSDFACDRGLAYDLLGRQADAQADYRAAQSGADADEASRRLALSLAISGNRAAALQTLSPLVAKGDPGGGRARAFVLALTGDSSGAMVAIDTAMPGSWARVSPFLQRLPTLKAGDKAAAVNLGIFPDSGDAAYAYAAPPPGIGSGAVTASTDRLTGIDALLRAPASPPPVQVAYVAPAPRAGQPQPMAQQRPRKIWLQLASGTNPSALPEQFQRIKSKNRELFDGITPYVATSANGARLVIGPFRGASDAETFAEDLETLGVDAREWSNSETDQIVPLGTE
jgi:Flp pilus assembly protein TadD